MDNKLENSRMIHGTYRKKPRRGEKEGATDSFMGMDIDVVSALYDPFHPKAMREVEGGWMPHQSGGKYFPPGLSSLKQAREEVAKFVFPESLKNSALSQASKLAWLLVEKSGARIRRNQAAGRFDPRAAGRVMQAVAAGNYDAETVRPFTRHFRENPRRPHVAIVAAGNWAYMWRDSKYISNIGVLTSAVAWTCEALGCACTSVIARHVMGRRGMGSWKEQLGLLYLSRPGHMTPLDGYTAVFHQEMYRMGMLNAFHAHPHHVEVRAGLEPGKGAAFVEAGNTIHESADENFDGVAWARQQGATIVVSIGEFSDSGDADIALGNDFSLDTAIGKIANHLSAQKQARAA